MPYNGDLRKLQAENLFYIFISPLFFNTASLLIELLQREVTFHSVATEVKIVSAPKCTFYPQICSFFSVSINVTLSVPLQ